MLVMPGAAVAKAFDWDISEQVMAFVPCNDLPLNAARCMDI